MAFHLPFSSNAMAKAVPSPAESQETTGARRRRMVSHLSKLATGEWFSPSRLPNVKFMRSTRHVPSMPVQYDPSICVIVQGRKRGRLGQRSFVYDGNNYLVLSVPLPFECETWGTPEEPMYGISIGITAATVAELMMEIERPKPLAAGPTRAVQASALDPVMAEATLRLIEALGHPDDARVLGPQIVREITYRALMGPQGQTLQALASPGSHFGQISRSLHRIHAEFNRPLEIPVLAREAGMSPSTFHSHFKAITASPPLQYIKSVRLHKARVLMVHEEMSAGQAAAAVGYESASQFSREFKRFFGGTPTAVGAQLRATLLPAA